MPHNLGGREANHTTTGYRDIKQNLCQLFRSGIKVNIFCFMQQSDNILLANSDNFSYLRIARVPNFFTPLCQLKRTIFKFLPGLAIGLGTLAGSYFQFRRAVLCLVPSILFSLLNSARYV